MQRPKYRSLTELLDAQISTEESEGTRTLIKKLRHVRKVKYLTKQELMDICYWKSPRAVQLIKENRRDRIKRLTNLAFTTRSERDKIKHLTSLKGVGIPMASAVLMLIWPKRYGVIDIRVWQLLFAVKSLKKKPQGIGFNFKNWYQYLCILRYHAGRLRVAVRAVERTLFLYHKELQTDLLYKDNPGKRFRRARAQVL
jgi:hypothetical protein